MISWMLSRERGMVVIANWFFLENDYDEEKIVE